MKKIMQGVELLAVIILLLLSGIVILQIVLRNFFNTGFVWVEELSRFLLLSMVLISAPVVFFKGEHVKFDLLSRKLPAVQRRIHTMGIIVLIVFFYCCYIVSHLMLMKNSGNVLSPSLNIPNKYFFLAGLLGAIIAIAAGIDRLISMLRGKNK